MKKSIILMAICSMLVMLAGCKADVYTEQNSSVPDTPSQTSIPQTNSDAEKSSIIGNTDDITFGTQLQRGFINDNVLHSDGNGDIHYSSYIPESYDGTTPYALFITLPGYEGLYFQGVGANMVEDFGITAQEYNREMIILSPQLDDWGETSANKTIALTEYFLSHYNIDPEKVYLEGYSGGGETLSLVMAKKPQLYTAALHCSSVWDGELQPIADARIPIYFAIGESDEYYGSASIRATYEELMDIYESRGLSANEITSLVVLDVKNASYFTAGGVSNQHGGGSRLFAADEQIIGWLFGEH